MADKPKFLSKEGLLYFWTAIKNILSEKVDKEDGKGLSSNDYSTEEKNKLNNIENGAQVNIIQSIKVNNQTQTINQKNVNITVPLVDSSLKNIGQSADAKATGDAIAEVSTQFTQTATAIRQEFDDADNQLAQEITQALEDLSDTIPTKTSQLQNDSDFTTKQYVDGELDTLEASIPTKVSQLQNDSYYATTMQLSDGLATKEDVLQYGTATAEDVGKAMMPKTVADGKVTSWEFGEAGKVDDVQVDGTSILENKVANIPIADSKTFGVVKAGGGSTGIQMSNGYLTIVPAAAQTIKIAPNATLAPIIPGTQHQAVFYGLAKAAGDTTQSSSSNGVGTYTDSAKIAIQSMLGINTAIADAVGDITSFEFQVVTELPATGTKGIIYLRAHFHEDNDVYDEYIWVTDRYERLGTLDIDLSNYVTFDDYAGDNTPGLVQINSFYGIDYVSGANKRLRISGGTDSEIKLGTSIYKPVNISKNHVATFYGLAKAAGHDEKDSTLEVGTYTDEAKSAIQSMLGVPSEDDVVTDVQVNGTSVVTDGVATVPIASGSDFGVVKVSSSYGLQIYGSGANRNIGVIKATDANIKSASAVYSSITPDRQHISAFYGLAKAAGDTTQSASSNAVGTYTEEAKVAIRNMIDATGESASVTVTGIDPVIQASRNTRYICGEILSLDFTPCASGICEVIFTSGSSVTVLTLPETVKMPEWFEVETNHTYEISVVDGVYGAVMVW